MDFFKTPCIYATVRNIKWKRILWGLFKMHDEHTLQCAHLLVNGKQGSLELIRVSPSWSLTAREP